MTTGTEDHSRAGIDHDLVQQAAAITTDLAQRPSWGAYFMATALLLASRSSCERLSGAVWHSMEPPST